MEAMKLYLEKIFVLGIVKASQDGMSKCAARLSDVSLSSVKRYARIAEREVSLVPRKGGGRSPRADRTTRGGCSKRT
jgi:hypothetical protein